MVIVQKMQGPMHRRRMLDNSEYLNITRRHIECFPIFKYLEYCKADAYENSKQSSSSNSTPPRSLSRASIRSARLTEARGWRSRDSALLHLRVRSLILEKRSGFWIGCLGRMHLVQIPGRQPGVLQVKQGAPEF